jgi:hypothetical protein
MDQQVAELEAEFPWWEVWRGVTGVLYARRLKSSPPLVVRAHTWTALRARICVAEARLARRMSAWAT